MTREDAAARRYIDFDEAIEMGVRLALSGTPSREAAVEVYDVGLRPATLATFAIRGIASHINDRLAVLGDSWSERVGEIDPSHGSRAARGRQMAVHPHYARDHWQTVLSVKTWEGADGRRKALLDFDANDATLVRDQAFAKVVGLQKVAGAMQLVIDLLAKHRATTVAGLPVKAKASIAEAVA